MQEPLFDYTRFPRMMDCARLDKALSKQARYSDGVATLGEKLHKENAAHGLLKSVSDGAIDYDRIRFNRMNHDEQAAYMARLNSRRHYWASRPDGTGWKIPKIVFDALTCPLESGSLCDG